MLKTFRETAEERGGSIGNNLNIDCGGDYMTLSLAKNTPIYKHRIKQIVLHKNFIFRNLIFQN